MDTPQYFELSEGYAVFRPVRHLSLPEAIDWASKIVAYSVEQQIPRLLVDTTKLTGFGPPLTWDRFQMGERLARAARGATIKVVFVALPKMIDPKRLGVNVARIHGLLANVFDSEAAAREWLLDPNAK